MFAEAAIFAFPRCWPPWSHDADLAGFSPGSFLPVQVVSPPEW